MIKRISTAAIGIAVALSATSAYASPYFGFDGRHYGELEDLPHFGRPRGILDASDAPRECLTPAVREVLEKVEDVFGPVSAISTCRPGARIAGTGRISRHASGNAVDFEAGSKKAEIVKWLVANHHSGGTMTYSGMSHIHIDVGPHFVALAGGGTRTASRSSRGARYAEGYEGHSRYDDGGSRRYAREAPVEARGYYYRYGGTEAGSQFASGYATIYR